MTPVVPPCPWPDVSPTVEASEKAEIRKKMREKKGCISRLLFREGGP